MVIDLNVRRKLSVGKPGVVNYGCQVPQSHLTAVIYRRQARSSHLTSLVAYEHLQIRNLVKNRKLAKSISDAAWGRFLARLTSYGRMHDIPVIAVEPAFTSQECSGCHKRVKKSLSIRTHICPECGLVLDRDHTPRSTFSHKR